MIKVGCSLCTFLEGGVLALFPGRILSRRSACGGGRGGDVGPRPLRI